MADIDKLKKALAFGIKATVKIDEVTQDGWQWLSDSVALFPTLVEIPGLLKDGKEMWEELQEVDDEEKAELQQFAKDNFDIADDELEEVVESVFDWFYQTAVTQSKIRAALKKD